ncbi:S8 family serine peptidase [Metabacillus niabensis]|uniref:S8 family serine peptidase n=1 Tax=Metabacillus niabensis TaxID=324854 RepID=UPI0039A3DBCA
MMKILNKEYKLIPILFLLFFFHISTHVSASSHDIDNSYVIAMEEGLSNNVTHDLRVNFPQLKYEYIKDISILKVQSNNKVYLEEALDYLKDTYKIDAVSKEKQIEAPRMDIDKNQINKPSFHDTQYNSLKSNSSDKSMDHFETWQWNINLVTNDKKSYDFQMGNHEVTVAIIDSGIDSNHPDLKENIVGKGKSFIPDEESIEDDIGHGTMVAGIISSNGKLKGIAPNTGITPYKVINKDGGHSTWVIQAIIQAANDGHEVINISLGAYLSNKDKGEKALIKAYERAIKYAEKKGSIVVSSIGNDGIDLSNPKQVSNQLTGLNEKLFYAPGGLNIGLSVGAINKDRQLTSYSNYGRMLSVTAPGGDLGPLYDYEGIVDVRYMILTTYPTYLENYIARSGNFPKGYEFSYGTSLAAPTVSAVMALILAEYEEEKNRKLPIHKAEKILFQTTFKNNQNNKGKLFGAGIVDAYEALTIINTK